MNLKPNELLELVRAGYSKEEIQKLTNDEKVENVTNEKEAEDEKADEVNDTSNLDDIINNKVNNAFDKLNASVEAFNKKLESFNLMNAEMTSKMQDQKKESIEDILLGSILLPDGSEMKGE